VSRKKEETERWMKEAEQTKREREVWKIVNKDRRKKGEQWTIG